MTDGRAKAAASYNGDGHLSLFGCLAYLALNRLHNSAPYARLDPGLSIADFDAKGPALLADLPGLPSPSRAMCDLLWMRLPWDAIEREVGPLRILDLGCGSGRYGTSLQTWTGGRVARYVGVDRDAHPDWTRLAAEYPYLEFRRGDVQMIGQLIPSETNIIISQSTLEHVSDDVSVFEQTHAYARRYERPMLHIHLVPSQECLWTYLWHGYRQYTPRTLSARTRLFADSARLLVRLGGAASNRLHFRFITWPLLIRRRADRRSASPLEYLAELQRAVDCDMKQPQPSPAFYAVLVHSHARAALFDNGPWRVRTRGR